MSDIKKKILIVDDVESIALLMKLILTGEGFEVEIAYDGEMCMEKITSFQPELIILDIMMPGLHGIDVMKKLNAEKTGPKIGVIVCTAKNYKTDFHFIKELGACDIIIKPINSIEFKNKILEYFSATPSFDINKKIEKGLDDSEIYMPQLDKEQARLKLWGTRGSIPVSNAKFMRHGGNTSCLSIEYGENIVIIDAGSGIRDQGMEMLSGKYYKINIFIGHTHWDHIQGFPFYMPAYVPGFELDIYAASSFGKDIKSIFQGQFDKDYFPVQLEDMKARLNFITIADNPVVIGGIKIYWEYMNHPGAAIGFKIKIKDKTIAYVTDNEFLCGYQGAPHGVSSQSGLFDSQKKIIEFLTGVDLLIGEAQYTNEEYRFKIGWGHSSLSNACLLVKTANIKKWIITHHDPAHDDDFLQNKLNVTKKILREIGHHVEVSNAYDGLTEYL